MTQDEIIEMARQAGCPMADMMPMYFTDKQLLSMLEAFAKLVAAKEREACAKLCDGLADMHEKMNQWGSHITADTLAQAVRARGQA
jgi:hypothetical protein